MQHFYFTVGFFSMANKKVALGFNISSPYC